MTDTPSEKRALAKMVYAFHVFLTVVCLVGTIYLAFELHETQVELKAVRASLPGASEGSDEPRKEVIVAVEEGKITVEQEEHEQRATAKDASTKTNTRKRRSPHDLCAEQIRKIKSVLPILQIVNKSLDGKILCVPGPRGVQGPPGPPGPAANVSGIFEASPKIIDRPPPLLRLKEDKPLVLTCKATGVPPPTITWFKDDKPLSSELVFDGESRVAKIKFQKLTYSDGGRYRCQAKNSVGVVNAYVGLIFYEAPRRASRTRVPGYINTTTVLRCPVHSYLKMTVKWIRPTSTRNTSANREVNGTLIIPSVSRQDSGAYLCEASNMAGKTFTAIALEIRHMIGPSFVGRMPRSRAIFTKQKVSFKCTARGDPLPTVYWLKNGRRLPSVARKEAGISSALLQLDTFTKEDAGNYTCVADNEKGRSIQRTIKLYLVECPNLRAPKNGYTASLSQQAKNVALFSCASGTTLVGPNIRTCQPNGSWSGISTHCLDDTLANGSIILADDDEHKEQLFKWLGSRSWKRCYRGSDAGWSARAFHGACGSHTYTVTIVRVGQYIFGGYSDVTFKERPAERQRNGQYSPYRRKTTCQRSYSSFIFSLKNSKNAPPFKSNVYRNTEQSVCAEANRGPRFSDDLVIADYAGFNQQSSSNLGYSYQLPNGMASTALAGKTSFQPDEMEVFYKG